MDISDIIAYIEQFKHFKMDIWSPDWYLSICNLLLIKIGKEKLLIQLQGGPKKVYDVI